MKKFSIIFLVVCLFVSMFAVAALAEESQVIDLSEYDDDTIVALLNQVQAEIVSRGIERTASLYADTQYVFGTDIPAGTYIISKSSSDVESGSITLKSSDGAIKSIEVLVDEDSYEGRLVTEEGDILEVTIPCDLTVSAGVLFK